jgi:hypothetical protein
VVGNIVEREVAADTLEARGERRQRTTEIRYMIGDGAVRVCLARHRDQTGRNLSAGDARALGRQHTGQDAFTTGSIERLPTEEIAQEIQHARADYVLLQRCLLAPGIVLAVCCRGHLPRSASGLAAVAIGAHLVHRCSPTARE